MSLDKVLITGSSNGLGKYLALEFAKKGHDIILHGRNIEKLEDLQEKIRKLGVKVKYFNCNLSSQKEVIKLADFANKEQVKILINNAGVTCPGKELQDLDLEKINDMIDVNLKAPIILAKYMQKNLNNIININSMVGLEVKKFRTLYSASKWGLRGFSQSLKQELTNINVLDFYPTNIKTWPERENAMEIDFVTSRIYQAYQNKEKELILDGRK
jgi:short-subunit dehydrogenase